VEQRKVAQMYKKFLQHAVKNAQAHMDMTMLVINIKLLLKVTQYPQKTLKENLLNMDQLLVLSLYMKISSTIKVVYTNIKQVNNLVVMLLKLLVMVKKTDLTIY